MPPFDDTCVENVCFADVSSMCVFPIHQDMKSPMQSEKWRGE